MFQCAIAADGDSVSPTLKGAFREKSREDSTRGALFPTGGLAPIMDVEPEWIGTPEAGGAYAPDTPPTPTPSVRVPSDQWLPRRLSELGIALNPRPGDRAAQKEPVLKAVQEPARQPPEKDGRYALGTGHIMGSEAQKDEKWAAPKRPGQVAASVNDSDAARRLVQEADVAGPSAGTTAPFSVDSAASVDRRPCDGLGAELGDEPAVLSSSEPPSAGREKRTIRDRSRYNRLLLASLVVVSAISLLIVTVGLLKHWWGRNHPVVKGLFGAVRGQRLSFTDQGRDWTVFAFLGVPFAKVPRGPQRFKSPLPLDALVEEGQSGEALDSWAKRPPCPQQDFYLGQQRVNVDNGSEDCLHLNIWAPDLNCSPGQGAEPCQQKTVLFFLYGVSFQNGGNSFELYDGRYLSALGDVVVVVPNYRVGALGFLSGPSSKVLPGNAGLHDQRLALSWTLANIDIFGGNASRLVLAGHDAGAASLGYHLFSGDASFWTRNVVRFILQSGGPYHRYEGDGAEGARRLANSVQCPVDLSTEGSLRCLQDASLEAVARSKLAPLFVPVFNRAPLSRPEPRRALVKSLPKMMAGPQGKEFLLGRVGCEGAYQWFVEQQRSGSADPEQLAAQLVGRESLERWQNASNIALEAAVGDGSFKEAVGDILEVCPMSELAEQLHAWKNRVYTYVLAYRPSYSSWPDAAEAVHFEDVELVFGVPLRPEVPSSDLDKQWARAMIRVWATFARTGTMPVLQSTAWPAYDSLRLTTMRLGPKSARAQRDPKWQRCRLLSHSEVPPSS
ncbi:acetylcholinesterase-like isoform X3 [Amblyomma americanum]